MAFDWQSATVGDFVDLQRGNTYQSALLDTPGPVLLGLASIERNGGFRSDKLRTYGGESHAKLLVYPGDMYVSLKDVTQSGDLLGSVARVPSFIAVGRMTQDTVKLVFKNELIDRSYLYWVLRTPEYREYCRARGMGTTNLSLSRDDFLSFPVPKPTSARLSIQRTLDAIEGKITLNGDINQTLEAMAQAIFKSWFVDFDPVKAKIAAKAEGRDPLRAAMSAISGKSDAELDVIPPEQYGLLAATGALFPDEMEESELGQIPRGGTCSQLGDICSFTAGSAFKPEHQGYSEGDYPFIKVSDMNLAGNEVFIQSANNYVSKAQQSEMKAKLHPRGATVFAKIGVALISNRRRLLTTPTIIDNNLMSASPIEGKSGQYFLYSMLSTIDFNTLVSGTALPYINVSDLKKIPIVRPLHEVGCAFEEEASSIFSMMQILAAQSTTLAKTRDTLLPKLLSGEVEVSATASGG